MVRLKRMGRPPRAAAGGMIYHTLNRANGRLAIFEEQGDYAAFELTIAEALLRSDMRLLAYCVLPDHFHLLLWPRGDDDLSHFMRWLTLTHTQRWHAHHHTAGSGHLYQGRFKYIPLQTHHPFLTVCRFVERSPLKAGLAARAQDWRWGSLWQDHHADAGDMPRLNRWPIAKPADWTRRVNRPMPHDEEQAVLRSIQRGQPFGTTLWQKRTAGRLGLESTLRPRGRPRVRPANGS
jgi:putative transposase